MKNNVLIVITIVLCISNNLRAQDTLKFRDGTNETVIVEEISSTSVKYKKSENATGPSYTAPVNALYMIVYRNGARDVFSTPTLSYKNGQNTKAVPADVGDVPVVQPLKFGGPRLGCTFLGPGTSSEYITDKGGVPIVSQFGWQFETRIFTSTSGISGLVEFVPLIGGFEQGFFLPSGSLLFGLRGKGGTEFGAGPNVSLSGLGMVFAFGTSFHIDDIYFPVNIALVPSVPKNEIRVDVNGNRTVHKIGTGMRVSLLVGFNTRKR
jgi:hypothetical protein